MPEELQTENPPNLSFALRLQRWLKPLLWIVPMAIAVGSACAFFLWSLDAVTNIRFKHPWLLYFLPLAGLGVGLVYHRWGKSAEGGNNLIIDQIHEPGGGVPRRMAPLILFGTLATHLFGGSAGREGTAVQMGGSIAGAFARWFKLTTVDVSLLLMTGVSAGFGAVFGTPFAGAIFAIEVLTVGRLRYAALVPCFLAAVVADQTCHAWGIGHTHYAIASVTGFKIEPLLLAKVALAAVAFGLASRFFSELSHRAHAGFQRLVPFGPFRPVLGGSLVIALAFAVGTQDYLGLGVTNPDPKAPSIVSFFTLSEIHPWAWWWKIVFTVVTLANGFKGGEVTPLFFIGAALGNALAGLLGAPTDLMAGLGFVAIFAGATNTPLACTIMGMELFGAHHGIYLGVACFIAFACSGRSGIYLSQRFRKTGESVDPSLRQLRADRERNFRGQIPKK